MRFKKGDRVKSKVSYAGGDEGGTVVLIDNNRSCKVLVKFDNWDGGHGGLEYNLGGNDHYFMFEDDLIKIEEDEKMFKMYEVGDVVKCIDRTEENHEKLELGKCYTVIGYSSLDGNIVYSLKDSAGNMVFSMDRFEVVKPNRPAVDMDEALKDMPIRCDSEVKEMGIMVGDIVKVKDMGKIYTTYEKWAETYLKKFGIYGYGYPSTDKEYEVVVKEMHMSFKGTMLCGIREVGGNQLSRVYIFGDNGLELIDRPLPQACCNITKKAVELIAHSTFGSEKRVVEDAVNHPSHYTDGGIETIDYIQAKLTQEGFKGYLIGNTMKYISRAGKKADELEDLKKGRWYLEKLISTIEGGCEVATPVESVPVNSKITQKQIGYIAGLTKKLNLDRYDLPSWVSPLSNYRELTEAEATAVIDRLLAIKNYEEGER